MAESHEAIQAEFENIETVLAELPDFNSLDKLSTLELAGVAALLHNFYNGVENSLKQCLIMKNTSLPAGPTWHRDLIETAYDSKINSPETAEEIKQYLAFRHFFSHGYSFHLKSELMKPLVQDVKRIYAKFRAEIEKCIF